MFFNQLIGLYRGSDVYIWFGAVADLGTDKWTFQKLSDANVPDMDQWVKKVRNDIALDNSSIKKQAIKNTIPYKAPNTYSKKDLETLFYAALQIDENKVRLLVRKTKNEIKKWIKKYIADEKKEASIARYVAKL